MLLLPVHEYDIMEQIRVSEIAELILRKKSFKIFLMNSIFQVQNLDVCQLLIFSIPPFFTI